MGNTCYSIAIPKSAIVAMISTEVPPSSHGSLHEDGGSDEVDATGLTGAGGGIAVDDFLWFELFPALDTYTQTTSNSGPITLTAQYLTVKSGATISSYAEMYRLDGYPFPTLTWDKERTFQVQAKLVSETDENGHLFILSGRNGAFNRHIGFKVEDGVLYGEVANGSALFQTTLETLGVAAYSEFRRLEAKHFPGVRTEFWVDGVKVGENTTVSEIPSGSGGAIAILELRAGNPSNAKNIEVQVSSVKVWQEA